MMINKRLIGTVSESKKYVAGNVALQWCSLAANIAMMTAVTGLLAALYEGTASPRGYGVRRRQRSLPRRCASRVPWARPGWAIVLQGGEADSAGDDLSEASAPCWPR